MEFKNKNDYSIIIFYRGGGVQKMGFAHSVKSVVDWLGKKDWEYLNVYVRRSGRFLIQVKNDGGFYPYKPR